MSRVTIIGTGYIGASIGLGLKAQNPGLEIVGHDREYSKAGEAKKIGALDRADWNLPSALEGAGLVIIATPLAAVERLLSQIGEFLEPGCVVTDTAMLKAPVLGWADRFLSSRASFVGGHPILRRGTLDLKPAAATFQGGTYCVVPALNAPDEAVDQVIRLARVLGSEPLFLDAVEHDSFIASADQLPSILATSLVSLAMRKGAWRDGQRLAGEVFGAATLLALNDPAEHQVSWIENREMLLRSIGGIQEELGEIARLLEAGSADELQATLDTLRNLRAEFQPATRAEPQSPAPEVPRARDQWSGWLFGGLRGRRP